MRLYLLTAAFTLFTYALHAQFSISFCETITAEGKAVKASNTFAVGSNGSLLKLLVAAPESFNTDKLEYRIYHLNSNGAEVELARYTQTIETDWTYAWKELVFFDQGSYRVKIYNGSNTYLTSANVAIKKI